MTRGSSDRPVVYVIFGPTGVGKSDIVSELSEKSDISLISADSIQVYRGLDIGSAKPSAEERAACPHYLIDIRNPDETFSVGDFVSLSDIAVRMTVEAGRIPVISGGTAFYIKNFIYGLSDVPECDEVLRGKLEAEAAEDGTARLVRYLMEADPVSASRIDPRNVRRLVRAVEVCMSTGRPFSSFGSKSDRRGVYDFRLIGLTRGSDSLRRRVRSRLDLMFERGLADEAHALIDSGLNLSHQSMNAIGYREFFDKTLGTEDEIRERIFFDTVHYAKRQMTFFKSFGDVEWIDLDVMPAAGARSLSLG